MYLINNAFPKWIGKKIRDETYLNNSELRDRYGTQRNQRGNGLSTKGTDFILVL